MTMKTAIELIAEERAEHITKHGWTAWHDDQHTHGELAINAASLACTGTDYSVRENNFPEREHQDDWGLKRRIGIDRIKALTVAGALIAAELDRVLRELAKPI